jgi:hypothetical protein
MRMRHETMGSFGNDDLYHHVINRNIRDVAGRLSCSVVRRLFGQRDARINANMPKMLPCSSTTEYPTYQPKELI